MCTVCCDKGLLFNVIIILLRAKEESRFETTTLTTEMHVSNTA